MRPFPLDPHTADRLAAGALAPEDAPPGYNDVAALLQSVRSELTAGGLEKESETVAAVVAAVRSQLSDRTPAAASTASSPLWFRLKVLGGAFAATLTLGSGLAAANVLPAPAQRVASHVLDAVGLDVPAPAARDNSTTASSDTGEGSHPAGHTPPAQTTHPASPGSTIAGIARTTDSTGVDKGAEISGVASDGKSHAGEHGGTPATSTTSSTIIGNPAVPPPTRGGPGEGPGGDQGHGGGGGNDHATDPGHGPGNSGEHGGGSGNSNSHQ